jgi:eukaryotic-like serine/threonine-protein kinase
MRVFLGILIGIFLGFALISAQILQAQDEEDEGDGIGIAPETTPNNPHVPDAIWSIAWSPDSSKIAYGIGASTSQCNLSNNDYSVHVIDVSISVEFSSLGESNTCPVTNLDWSPDSSIILSGSQYDAAVWQIHNGQYIGSIVARADIDLFTDHDWSPNGNLIASMSEANYTVRVWNPLTGEETNSFDMEGDYSTSLTWSPDSRHIAIGSTTIEIWDVVTETQVQPYFTTAASHLTWSPDGTRLGADFGYEYQVVIFDMTNGNLLKAFDGHTELINQVSWSPDSRYLASASDDGTVRIWDAETGEAVDVFEYGGEVYSVDWSPDGEYLAFGGSSSDGQDAELEIVPFEVTEEAE